MIIHHCTGRQRECHLENVTLCFCNNFYIIQCHCTCKMCSNYPGIKLESALLKNTRRQNWTFLYTGKRKCLFSKRHSFPKGSVDVGAPKWPPEHHAKSKDTNVKAQNLDNWTQAILFLTLKVSEMLKNWGFHTWTKIITEICIKQSCQGSQIQWLSMIYKQENTLFSHLNFLFLLLNPCVPSESQSRISDAWGFCSQTFPTPWLFSLLISVLLVVG